MATQKRPLPSVEKAKAPTLRTIGDIFDAAYQAHAFDPPISGGGGGGGVFNYTDAPFYSLYGPYIGGYTTPVAYRGNRTITIGYGANATGYYNQHSIAIGSGAEAGIGGYQTGAIAIGYNANCLFGGGVSIGRDNISIGSKSISIGMEMDVRAQNSIAFGIGDGVAQNIPATSTKAIAIGYHATIGDNHDQAVVIGNAVTSPSADSVTIGVSATNRISFDTWTTSVSAATTTHRLPVLIGGTRYYILLSNV